MKIARLKQLARNATNKSVPTVHESDYIKISDQWSYRLHNDKIDTLRERGIPRDYFPGRDNKTGQQVLVKVFDYGRVKNDRKLSKDYDNWRDYKYDIAHESRMHFATRDHPHVLGAVDTVYDDELECGYIIMEAPEGMMSLTQYFKLHAPTLEEDGELDGWRPIEEQVFSLVRERFAKEILRQLVSAVGYLHTHFIEHRDLCPDNIFICPGEERPYEAYAHQEYLDTIGDHDNRKQRQIKRLSAKQVVNKSPVSNKWTAPCVKLGQLSNATLFFQKGNRGACRHRVDSAPAYSAPETRYEGLESPGGTQDIWAIGMMAHKLTTLRMPERFTDKNLLYKIETQSSFMTMDLRNLVVRCLKIQPGQRPTVTELSTHPWFGHCSKAQGYYWKNPWVGPDPMVPIRCYAPRRIYGPVDFHIPRHRLEQFVLTKDQMSVAVMEEASQGYWGWWNGFDVEEMLEEWITDSLEVYAGTSTAGGNFSSPQFSVYMLAADYLAYTHEKRHLELEAEAPVVSRAAAMTADTYNPSEDMEMLMVSRRSSDHANVASGNVQMAKALHQMIQDLKRPLDDAAPMEVYAPVQQKTYAASV